MQASQCTLCSAQIICFCICRAPNRPWSRLITRSQGKQFLKSKYFNYATEKQIPFFLWLALSLPLQNARSAPYTTAEIANLPVLPSRWKRPILWTNTAFCFKHIISLLHTCLTQHFIWIHAQPWRTHQYLLHTYIHPICSAIHVPQVIGLLAWLGTAFVILR